MISGNPTRVEMLDYQDNDLWDAESGRNERYSGATAD